MEKSRRVRRKRQNAKLTTASTAPVSSGKANGIRPELAEPLVEGLRLSKLTMS